MTPDRLTVRRPLPADERALGDLSLGARRAVLHVPWTDLRRALRTPASHAGRASGPDGMQHRAYDLHVVERDGQPGCLWASVIEPASVAQLRALILHDDWPLPGTLDVLLPQVKPSLRAAGVTTLAFVGVEQWLLDGLAAEGFTLANTVVTLHKDGCDVPSSGNRQAAVRPAAEPDFAPILDIDERAFEPLWRNTPLTLAEWLQACPYFSVAELERQVVGYACASLAGRHGHLTRIAVHPQYHGRQIGVRLLADAMRFFRRARVFGVTVNTQQDNLRARRLYEWFGFVLLGQEAEVWVTAP
jgi:ribosomal protein S18 acetylase RimI-like enzyme